MALHVTFVKMLCSLSAQWMISLLFIFLVYCDADTLLVFCHCCARNILLDACNVFGLCASVESHPTVWIDRTSITFPTIALRNIWDLSYSTFRWNFFFGLLVCQEAAAPWKLRKKTEPIFHIKTMLGVSGEKSRPKEFIVDVWSTFILDWVTSLVIVSWHIWRLRRKPFCHNVTTCREHLCHQHFQHHCYWLILRPGMHSMLLYH